MNVDFSLICSAYSLKDINELEKQLLELLMYNVSISASLYASYYFELRTLCEKADRQFTLKPLTEEQQATLVSRSDFRTEELQSSERRWKSLGTVATNEQVNLAAGSVGGGGGGGGGGGSSSEGAGGSFHGGSGGGGGSSSADAS